MFFYTSIGSVFLYFYRVSIFVPLSWIVFLYFCPGQSSVNCEQSVVSCHPEVSSKSRIAQFYTRYFKPVSQSVQSISQLCFHQLPDRINFVVPTLPSRHRFYYNNQPKHCEPFFYFVVLYLSQILSGNRFKILCFKNK